MQQPIEVEDLRLDVVLLSHTHYDHLDIPSAKKIGNRALWSVMCSPFSDTSQNTYSFYFFTYFTSIWRLMSHCPLLLFPSLYLFPHRVVPLGVKLLLKEIGITRCVELNWWEKHSLSSPSGKQVDVVFMPTRHWTSRTLFDRNKALWGSFSVFGPKNNFFFSGDTAICPIFKTIGDHFGPFDVSAISIGAYKPRWLKDLRLSPWSPRQMDNAVMPSDL